jgi:hypothetical protein
MLFNGASLSHIGSGPPDFWLRFSDEANSTPGALLAPTGVSPAATTEHKQHQKNNQYGRHLFSPSICNAMQVEGRSRMYANNRAITSGSASRQVQFLPS